HRDPFWPKTSRDGVRGLKQGLLLIGRAKSDGQNQTGRQLTWAVPCLVTPVSDRRRGGGLSIARPSGKAAPYGANGRGRAKGRVRSAHRRQAVDGLANPACRLVRATN